ncbi:MAG: DUF2194 domain-containing protein [Candidatus Omnitrophota bacterium]
MKDRFLSVFLLPALLMCSIFSVGYSQKTEGEWMEPPPRLVLALFDSSDKTFEKRNDIKLTLEAELVRLGFQVETHDIQKGLPPDAVLKRCRGIITWYKDPEMKDAERYCRWLAGQIRNGKKLVIIDNFGAYQDKKNGAWVPAPVVNDVLNQIGVDYRANWTADPKVLEIVRTDKSIVGTFAPVNLTDVAHYYYFKKLDASVRDYLTVRRLDTPESESSVIFSHPRGGMALTRYFLARDPKSGRDVFNIHFGRFLEECFYGVGRPTVQKILIVGEPRGESVKLVQNVAQTLDYAKIGHARTLVESLAEFTDAGLTPYSSLILCAVDLSKITPRAASAIRRYVRGGGGLCVVRGALHPKLNGLFGIRAVDPHEIVSTEGLRLAHSFFPAASSVVYEKQNLENRAFRPVLHPGSRVLAETVVRKDDARPGEVPAAWLHVYGRGRVFYWNADFLYLRALRGLLLHSVLLTRPVSVFSFANIENIHVDDAPQPTYNLYREIAGSTMDLTDTEFSRWTWWKDVLELSAKHGLSLTFYAVFNYDGLTVPPFKGKEFLIGKDNAFLESAKDVLDHNFELGFHGYNHEPLVIGRGEKKWTKKNMRRALAAARDYWTTYFSDMAEPFSYVAPMNRIDREGKLALREIFPSIRIISTVLTARSEEETMQEFGPDPEVPEFFNIPRITAGYFLSPVVQSDLINAVNSLGVWTHFIHPDDLFVESRYTRAERKALKTREWATLRDSFDSLFSFVRTNFPWLRNFSTKEAYEELAWYLKDRRTVDIQKNKVRIRFASGTRKSKFFGVRVNDGSEIGVLTNCRFLHVDKPSAVFLFESSASWAEIELKKAAP